MTEQVNETTTVRELVGRCPQTRPVFEQHGIDYCCGGGQSLTAVAKAGGLELQVLVGALKQAAANPPSGPGQADKDWYAEPLASLAATGGGPAPAHPPGEQHPLSAGAPRRVGSAGGADEARFRGAGMSSFQLKRVYEEPSRKDGLRVLVDRLWPRGLTKERAAVNLWLKDVAPSTELRKWFGHDPAKWQQFQARYRKELREKKDALELLRQKSEEQAVTLLYGARDEEHNEARVLKSVLEGRKKNG